MGFLAQDLLEAQEAAGAGDYAKLVLESNPDQLFATPGNLMPVVVKALQELAAENQSLRTEFEAYKASHP
jgi:hypothetical protein